MFKPLATCYSHELTTFLQRTQGLVAIKKGNFFPLFWKAWVSSFRKETILKSFEATGIWPANRNAVLKCFNNKASDENEMGETTSAPQANNWRQLECFVCAVVKDTSAEESKKLAVSLHHFKVESKLLHYKNNGLKAALTSKKKHNKCCKPLDLQQRQEHHSKTTFWSPDKIQEAQARRVVIECEDHERQLQKANNKELKAAAKLYKEKIAEEKRVAREAAKVLKEKARAEKAAKRAARMEAQNTNKSLQTSQVGKRKASQASEPKAKCT
jgi:hypothetical protein